MSFLEAIISGFKNVLHFKGRSSRSEYNYWMLFLFFLFSFSLEIDPPLQVTDVYLGNDLEGQAMDDNIRNEPFLEPFKSRLFSFVYFVALLPTIAVTVRRFHDIGKSGWFILLPLTIIGIIPYHYWTCLSKGDPDINFYGKNPLYDNPNGSPYHEEKDKHNNNDFKGS